MFVVNAHCSPQVLTAILADTSGLASLAVDLHVGVAAPSGSRSFLQCVGVGRVIRWYCVVEPVVALWWCESFTCCVAVSQTRNKLLNGTVKRTCGLSSFFSSASASALASSSTWLSSWANLTMKNVSLVWKPWDMPLRRNEDDNTPLSPLMKLRLMRWSC